MIKRLRYREIAILCAVWLCLGARPARAQSALDGPDQNSSHSRDSFRALSGQDRWRNYKADAFLSPGPFFGTVMPALGQQGRNEPVEYGDGWAGLGERLGRRAALYQLQAAISHSSAAALGTEPGYRRCRCTGGAKRLGYALSRSFLTTTSSGRTAPNVAYLGGIVGGAAIATEAWYPDRYSALGDGVRASGAQVGVNTAINVIQEFAPELKRLFRRK